MTGEPSIPDFAIIGAMKCSTSTLHDQLKLQSGISMSDPKEPNFFSDGPNFARGIDWYRSLFESMPVGDLKGESSTHLTKYPVHPDSAQRLHNALPDIKLVYVMRDPVDRIVSQFIHEWSEHTIRVDINHAIREHTRLISYSSYAMQIGKYSELFGQGSILPVFFERLMTDPQPEFERICKHIGFHGNARWDTDRGAQNVSSSRHRWPPALRAMLDFRAVTALRRTLLSSSMRARLKSPWSMKQKPILSQESIEYLHEQLDPDMQRLGEQLGLSITCARFKEAVRESTPPEWIVSEVNS